MTKKNSIIILVVMLVALCFGGCSSNKKDANVDGNNVGNETGNVPSVMLLVPGSLGDKSFFDSANEGLKLVSEKYGCNTKVIEMGTDQTKFAATFEDVIDEGWDIIITGGINVSPILVEIAEEYPEQKFILYDESVDYAAGDYDNIYCMTYKSYEGAYLGGILAALTTTSTEMPHANESKAIGFMGGFDIPLINDHLVGYIQGAREIVPDIKVGVGYSNSFTDAAMGKEIGLSLYNSGIDIVYQAAGGAGLGVLDAAKEANAYAIGTDSDQSALFANDEDKANAILTSMMKRVDISIGIAIDKYINGSLPFGTCETFGIAEGCIELTINDWYNTNVPEDIRAKVAEYQEKISSGEIEVLSAFDMSDDEVQQLKDSVQM